MQKNETIYEAEKLAKFFHVTKQTIREWCKKGKLPAFKIGKEWKVRVVDLQKTIDRKTHSQIEKEQRGLFWKEIYKFWFKFFTPSASMKNFIKNNIVPCFIMLSGILISVWIIWGLNTLQEIVSIFSSLSIAVAFATYIYTKRQDKTTTAIEQISFFRKEIIPQYNKFANSIHSENPSYNFPRVVDPFL